MVTSTVGLGRIRAIHASEISGWPGVLAVITHHNAPRLTYREQRSFIDPAVGERLHVLQDDQVRFYGQPVAVVVAETLDDAEHAANSLSIEYEAAAPVVHLDATGAEEIVPGGGASRAEGDYSRGDADKAFAEAPVKVDLRSYIARENHNPMEPHATIASWTDDQLTLWSKSQFVANEAQQIAAVFGLPPENVQVICPFIGGGFGTTLRTWGHVTLAAIAAKHVNRPVKLTLTRKQMFYNTGHRPATRQRMALAADETGRLAAIIHEGAGETSRYEEFMEALTPLSTYLYSCPNVRTQYRLVPLDASSPNHMRGPGESSGSFALETALDELAVALDLDPVELRIRNEPKMNEAEDRPFSSRSMLECYRSGAARIGWSRRNPQPGEVREGRLLIGMGMASSTYPVFRGPAGATARRKADGSFEVEAAASDMGPGTYTSLTQVAADALGVAPEQVHVRIGNSKFPTTPPHGGSMTMASVGSAVHEACSELRREIDRRGSEALSAGVELTRTSQSGEEAKTYSMHSFGAIFVEVAVDAELALVSVRKAVGAYGVGRVINPRLAHSQAISGMVGGIGMALMEATILDGRDGRPVNGSMADYLMPVNLDISGTFEAHFVDEIDPHVNPLGAKGLGELALVGMAPAIANAIYNATGRRMRDLPIKLESLLES
jgi:xanthine dehydrogenase YagR molybdenum-binding subunit